MRWASLLRCDPEQLEIELRKLGITLDDLVADARDVPEPPAQGFDDLSLEAQPWRVLDWFGNEQHPQPAERTEWYGQGRTANWPRWPTAATRG